VSTAERATLKVTTVAMADKILSAFASGGQCSPCEALVLARMVKKLLAKEA